MTAPDAPSTVLMVLVIGGSVALIVLAAIALARSRRATTVTLFGRVVHRPRLWAAAAFCAGCAGLLFEARQIMPDGWQDLSLNILAVLFLTYLVLLFAHLFAQSRANRAGTDEPQSGP